MSSADNSYTARLARLRNRTIATFHSQNPGLRELGPDGNTTPESLRQSRALGQIRLTLEGPAGELTTVTPCCPTTCEPVCSFAVAPILYPGDLSGSESGFTLLYLEGLLSEIYDSPITITPPVGYPYETFIVILFPPYCNATSYSVTLIVNGSPVSFESIRYGSSNFNGFPYGDLGIGGAFVIFPSIDLTSGDIESVSVTLTASNSCSSETGDATFFCFLEGSPVALENGTTKPIETVAVGDRVVGAFGEINTVTGTISNNLGFVPIININGEHKTTAPHPHIAADHKFSCADPVSLTFAYGKSFPVSGADGTRGKRVIKGVNRERITKLQIGTVLQTLTGPRPVTTLETIRMPPATRVYHLTTDGSHSYTVDGYAVAGGATEDDFDYDAWTPK